MYIVKWHYIGNSNEVKTSVMTLVEFLELASEMDVIIQSAERV